MKNILQRNPLPIAVLLAALMSLWIVSGGIAGAGGPSTTLTPGSTDLVYIASGEGFPDALGVGPVAAVNGAPVILVPKNPPLHSATSAELLRLDPRQVVIVGGTAVISAEIETDLAALLPDAEIARLAGSNRYVTNAMVSESLFPVEAWVSIGAPAFHTDEPGDDSYVSTDVQAYLLGGVGYLYAPVDLPHGAQILQFKAVLDDGDPNREIVVDLLRAGPTSQAVVLGSISSSGSVGEGTYSGGVETNGWEFVDNENYSYVIRVAEAHGSWFGEGDLIMRRVMIQYRLGSPTPPPTS